MSSSFEMGDVDLFTTGTEGPPGQRVFYLQARQSGHVMSLRLEKQMVAALVEYLTQLMVDLPSPGELPAQLDLVEPVVAEWVVGSLGATYDEAADRFVVVAEEYLPEDEEDPVSTDERGVARLSATREQVAAFIAHGTEVVEGGRPLCNLCGAPIDPEGHLCVRMNGHRPTS